MLASLHFAGKSVTHGCHILAYTADHCVVSCLTTGLDCAVERLSGRQWPVAVSDMFSWTRGFMNNILLF